MQIECTDDNIGCSIEEALVFFKKCRVGLKVFDIYNNIIEEFVPENKNKHITSQTLYLVTCNSHMLILDQKLNSLKFKANEIGRTEKVVSPHNRIQDEKQKEYHVPENWEDIIDI